MSLYPVECCLPHMREGAKPGENRALSSHQTDSPHWADSCPVAVRGSFSQRLLWEVTDNGTKFSPAQVPFPAHPLSFEPRETVRCLVGEPSAPSHCTTLIAGLLDGTRAGGGRKGWAWDLVCAKQIDKI